MAPTEPADSPPPTLAQSVAPALREDAAQTQQPGQSSQSSHQRSPGQSLGSWQQSQADHGAAAREWEDKKRRVDHEAAMRDWEVIGRSKRSSLSSSGHRRPTHDSRSTGHRDSHSMQSRSQGNIACQRSSESEAFNRHPIPLERPPPTSGRAVPKRFHREEPPHLSFEQCSRYLHLGQRPWTPAHQQPSHLVHQQQLRLVRQQLLRQARQLQIA